MVPMVKVPKYLQYLGSLKDLYHSALYKNAFHVTSSIPFVWLLLNWSLKNIVRMTYLPEQEIDLKLPISYLYIFLISIQLKS